MKRTLPMFVGWLVAMVLASLFPNSRAIDCSVDITGCKNVCAGDTVTLTAIGTGPYLWSNGATTQSITVSPTIDTTYSVTVSHSNSTGPCPDNLPSFVNFSVQAGFPVGLGEP